MGQYLGRQIGQTSEGNPWQRDATDEGRKVDERYTYCHPSTLYAKFEVFSFNRSRYIKGSQNSKSGSRDPHVTPFDLILQILDISPRFQSVCQI